MDAWRSHHPTGDTAPTAASSVKRTRARIIIPHPCCHAATVLPIRANLSPLADHLIDCPCGQQWTFNILAERSCGLRIIWRPQG
jgi:hypothetical protein